jgi:hypothetical protein
LIGRFFNVTEVPSMNSVSTAEPSTSSSIRSSLVRRGYGIAAVLVALPAAAAIAFATPAGATSVAVACAPDQYSNVDGICVHDPENALSAPPGATAQCVDGTYSFSLHHRGTCSHHGGVAQFLG